MKSDEIDPEVKSLIKKHTGTVAGWGPEEICVEIGNPQIIKDLVQALKSKGWYLLEKESNNEFLVFHLGEISLEDQTSNLDDLDLSSGETWSPGFGQKALACVLIAGLAIIAFMVYSHPAISALRYATLLRVIILAPCAYVIYKLMERIFWKLTIVGAEFVIRGLEEAQVFRINQVKNVINEDSKLWAKKIRIVLNDNNEILCQGLSESEAMKLELKLTALKR